MTHLRFALSVSVSVSGQFRWLLSTLLETGLCCAVHRNSAGLTQGVDPNLGITFQEVKQTTLWSQCTCPLLRHTPMFAVDGGKLAADLWFCNVLWVAELDLSTTLSPSSSTSSSSLWALRL